MKKLRITVKELDATHAANVGGPVVIRARSFDLIAPDDLVNHMKEAEGKMYFDRWFDSFELVQED